MDGNSLSIMLPVRQLAGRLGPVVAECLRVAASLAADYELILVNDGSTDTTGAQADALAAIHPPVAVLHHPRQRGYRAALLSAWSVARGDLVLAMDLAGPVSIGELPRLVPAMADHAAAFAYRVPAPRAPRAAAFAAALALRGVPAPRDPALRYTLARANLRDLLPPGGPDALAHADLFAAAASRGIPVAQVAVTARPGPAPAPSMADILAALNSGPPPGPAARRGAALGAGALVAAWSLWLLRRWRRP